MYLSLWFVSILLEFRHWWLRVAVVGRAGGGWRPGLFRVSDAAAAPAFRQMALRLGLRLAGAAVWGATTARAQQKTDSSYRVAPYKPPTPRLIRLLLRSSDTGAELQVGCDCAGINERRRARNFRSAATALVSTNEDGRGTSGRLRLRWFQRMRMGAITLDQFRLARFVRFSDENEELGRVAFPEQW